MLTLVVVMHLGMTGLLVRSGSRPAIQKNPRSGVALSLLELTEQRAGIGDRYELRGRIQRRCSNGKACAATEQRRLRPKPDCTATVGGFRQTHFWKLLEI